MDVEQAHERDPLKTCWCKSLEYKDPMYYMGSAGDEHMFERPVIVDWLSGLGPHEELDDEARAEVDAMVTEAMEIADQAQAEADAKAQACTPSSQSHRTDRK